MPKILMRLPVKTSEKYKKILTKLKNDGIQNSQVHRAIIEAGCEMQEQELRTRIAINIQKKD